MGRPRKPGKRGGGQRSEKSSEREQATIIRLQNDPRLRAEQAKLRKLADHPVMREVAERGRVVAANERERREARAPSPAPKKSSRGAPIKLTPRETTRGMATVRRAEAEQRKKYPTRNFKQADAIKALNRVKLYRDGKLIKISRSTWLRHVVWPMFGRN